MNKDEILEKSRKENSQKDPYEMEVNLNASQMGSICAVALCLILFVIQILVGGGMNYGLWSIIMSANGGSAIYKGIKLSNRNNLILGAAYLFCALLGAIVSVYSML